MKHTDEWSRGDTAQRRWADLMVQRGHAVLPVHAFDDVVPDTKAPVMLVPEGIRVTPDVLLLRARHGALWHEVKSKSVPTWYRIYEQWEHGCDYALALEYQAVQIETGTTVQIIVHETRTPIDPYDDAGLMDSETWLFIPLKKVFRVGEHRPDWPGGRNQPHRRGRSGMGGLLWPRHEMKIFDANQEREADS